MTSADRQLGDLVVAAGRDDRTKIAGETLGSDPTVRARRRAARARQRLRGVGAAHAGRLEPGGSATRGARIAKRLSDQAVRPAARHGNRGCGIAGSGRLHDRPGPACPLAALEFFGSNRSAAGGERVEDLVAGDRSLFAGIPDPTGLSSDTLEVRLLSTLAGRMSLRDAKGRMKSPRALDLAKAEVLRPGRGAVLYSSLSRADSDWLAKNAAAIARTGPEAWYWLMITMPHDKTGEAALQLARVPGVDRAELRQFVERRWTRKIRSERRSFSSVSREIPRP